MASLPEGIVIAKPKSQKQQQDELSRLDELLDDQLAGQRFVQPYDAIFLSQYMNKLLSEVHRQDEKTQFERQILDTLNKEAKEKGSNTSGVTYDSMFSMKIFKLLMAEPATSVVN